MSFFESQPPAPSERPPPGRQPAWVGPPENELGASVPLRLVLGSTEELAIGLVDVVAYTTGFALRLAIRVRPDAPDIDPRNMMMQLHGGPRGASEEQLLFGVEFSDGRKATNLDARGPRPDTPLSIRLARHGGGGGGGRSWQTGYWVYPLPPPGTLKLALAWTARDLPEQTHMAEAEPIIEAADDSTVLWEDDRPIRPDGSDWVSSTG